MSNHTHRNKRIFKDYVIDRRILISTLNEILETSRSSSADIIYDMFSENLKIITIDVYVIPDNTVVEEKE